MTITILKSKIMTTVEIAKKAVHEDYPHGRLVQSFNHDLLAYHGFTRVKHRYITNKVSESVYEKDNVIATYTFTERSDFGYSINYSIDEKELDFQI